VGMQIVKTSLKEKTYSSFFAPKRKQPVKVLGQTGYSG